MTPRPEQPTPGKSAVALAAALVAALAVLVHVALDARPAVSLLSEIAQTQFSWGTSTTPIPVSSVSPLLKLLLARDERSLPDGLRAHVGPPDDTVAVQAVRDWQNARRLARIRQLCLTGSCLFDEVDPVFGLTPLHLAAFAGDAPLMSFLSENGAVPREDRVGRMPRNLTFANFIPNSKRWARAAGRNDCDLPEVVYDGSPKAAAEVRRLVGEGEPVLIRGVLQQVAPELLDWSPESFVNQHGESPVTVGAVPYAAAFNLSTSGMTLREFYTEYVEPKSCEMPLYVFNQGPAVCRPGYDALVKLMAEAFPMPELVGHPDATEGIEGIHYFFGSRGSGAPFHIHADAINVAVSGSKHWYIFTPGRTLYSRKTIKRWVDEDYAGLPEEDKPLECLQRPGDVVYVPLDWGHGVLNLDDNTFGYALELLNKRDTLSHIASPTAASN